MAKIDMLPALKITTEAIKEYADGKPFVLYGESQNLSARERTIAKNNVGVYVGPEEPTGAVNGDIWFDTDEIGSAVPSVPSTPSTSSVIIDKTLTQDGQAADSKVVGDALAQKAQVQIITWGADD